MTGILLLFVSGLWLAIVIGLSKGITKILPAACWHNAVRILVFALLLPLPLIDEIVGGRQFEQLCKDNATIQIDRATATGKTVYFDPQPDSEIKGTWVRVVLQPKRFVDVTTGETVVAYNELIAEGGLFLRMLGISEGGMPLTFRGSCVPKNRPGSIETFRPLGINYIEPPLRKSKRPSDAGVFH